MLLAGLFVITVADAQSLSDTTPATQTRSTTRVEPVKAPAPSTSPAAPITPTSRSLVSPMPTTLQPPPQPPVPVRGASRSQDADGPTTAQPLPANTQVKVYDRNGRLIPGMKAAGANRVLDTRTGRYHDTVPIGDGQRIVR
jgi:hypothetical protein